MGLRVGVIGEGADLCEAARAWKAVCQADGNASLVAIAGGGASPGGVPCEGVRMVPEAEEAIASPDVDLVDIVAPLEQRADLLRSAMAAGKHILCESPLTSRLNDAEEIAALGPRCLGAKQSVFWPRFVPALVDAASRIGEPARIAVCVGAGGPDDGPGGPLGAAGQLAADIVRWIAGDIAEAAGIMEPLLEGENGFTEGVTALARCESGAAAVLMLNTGPLARLDTLRVEAIGSEGAFRFDAAQPDRLMECTVSSPEWRETRHPLNAESVLAAAAFAARQAFVNSITTGDPPRPSFRDAMMAMRIVDAIGASIDEGVWRPVDRGR